MANLGAMGMPTITRAYDCPFRSAVGLLPSHVTESLVLPYKVVPSLRTGFSISPRDAGGRAQFNPYADRGRAPPLLPTPA